ncbi:hypothetical protein E4U41_001488 [Claviceps citrina]|nr:hypothetical protein E4U41_001488 [Claviceps citrina]
MKYAAAIFALVATVTAAPTGGENVGQCNNINPHYVCCEGGGLLGGLLCNINLLGLGGSCNGGSYCCESEAPQSGIINLNLLNCVKLL